MEHINDETLVVTLTIGQLKQFIANQIPTVQPQTKQEKQYAYGLKGISEIFGCSVHTANQIKQSGKIDAAISQINRIIVVDVDLALELASRKSNLSNTRALEKRGSGSKLKVGEIKK